jgi:hypothetical protein
MKLSNRQIILALPILKKLQETVLPVDVQFQLSKSISVLEPISEIFNKIKDKVVLKYCQKDENGQPKKSGLNNSEVTITDITNFNKEISTLEGLENEVHISKFSADINLPVKDLLAIEWIFNE